jgi:hypothetical protein
MRVCVDYSNAPILLLARSVRWSHIRKFGGELTWVHRSQVHAPLCVRVGTAAVADAVGVMLKYAFSSNMESKEKEYNDR